MSWIQGYNPEWVEDKEAAIELVKSYSRKWIGNTISSSYVGWFSPDNEWDENLPIVLIIGDVQYEICWQKFDSLAITSKQINLYHCICSGELTPYKRNYHEAINKCLEKEIVSVELGMSSMTLEGKVLPMINSIDFHLVGGFLTIYNALDENGLSNEPANV
ncbi:hypothetical protein [Marinomonas spartinae]|uniref:hypothetical protein n=1 Tax=Marinomonas spartinae TaxID=1792290 RepID=UPI0018F23614|nr:hypothetical protein [Marinomonas spartinae]MBJ7557026.1 hypothetical protein [Marinomonas spartinae]